MDDARGERRMVTIASFDIHGNLLGDHGLMKERASRLRVYAATLVAVATRLDEAPDNLRGSVACLKELDGLMKDITKLLD